MADKCEISVVIPYYNKWTRTKYLIESLNRQDMDIELFEVIFVDDGSEQALKFLIKNVPVRFNLKIIEIQNSGRSVARNIGLKHANSEIVIFIDDDIILSPGFIRSHFHEHEINKNNVFVHGGIYDLVELTPYSDPETGEKFNHLEKVSNTSVNKAALLSFNRVFENWENFILKKRVSRLEKLIQQLLLRRELSFLHWVGCVGGNLSVKRKVLEEVGGYDENFKVWGGEDFELGYRLVKQGVSAVYDTEGFVYHITHAHSHHFKERQISGNYFLKKYNDPFISLLYNFLEMEIGVEEFIEKAKR